jgi:hypothetical protein
MEDRDIKTGHFVKGKKGGPGRPKGSRNRLGEAFLADIADDWEQNGVAAIQSMRIDRPHEYVRVVASILPKEINLTIDPMEEMTDDELDSRIRQLAAAIGLEGRAGTFARGKEKTDSQEPAGDLPTLQ